MKRFLIFFVILVSIITFVLTRPQKFIQRERTVSNEQIEEYRSSILEKQPNISDDDLRSEVSRYIRQNSKNVGETYKPGMSFDEALRMAIIVSLVVYGGIFILYHAKNFHYNEAYGTSSNPNDPLRGWRRFFSGKWF